jgi:hypothetical protein
MLKGLRRGERRFAVTERGTFPVRQALEHKWKRWSGRTETPASLLLFYRDAIATA